MGEGYELCQWCVWSSVRRKTYNSVQTLTAHIKSKQHLLNKQQAIEGSCMQSAVIFRFIVHDAGRTFAVPAPTGTSPLYPTPTPLV